MIGKPIFWDYITTDDEGELNGIREDAPEDAKKAYEEYLEERIKLIKDGVKI